MNESDRLNATLTRDAPALARCLSPLGRWAAFPKGIPYQADQARGAEIDATIGQLTDGRGAPIPLPALASVAPHTPAREVFLYAPVSGAPSVRSAWRARERRLGGAEPSLRTTLPFVSHGLTHGLSLLADLFVDDDTDVVLPTPAWENYELIAQLHVRPRFLTFPFFRDGRFNHEGLADTLAKVRSKALVVLNVPGNPSGYTPAAEEVTGIVDAVVHSPRPSVVVVDDAYQGWVYDDSPRTSLFWAIARRADPDRVAPIKVDGATKELAFFGSRIGFLTAVAPTEDAEAALESKLKCVARGTVGPPSGPAQSMVGAALGDPGLDAAFEALRQQLAARWSALRSGLATLDDPRVKVQPFNSAYFALLQLGGGLDAESFRVRLLADHGVGAIAFPEANALRLAYCSIAAERLPELVTRLKAALARA